MPIRAIIWDLNEVSLHGLKHSHRRIAPYSNHHHEEMWQLYREHGILDFFAGKISEDEFLRTFIKKHKLTLSLEEYKQKIREEFGHIEGTREIIMRLRERGYKLGLLSDHGREWAEFCEATFEHHQLYDAVTYSYEVGFCKPSAAMFARILGLLGVEPEESVFIDDNPKNVAGAESFGIRGIVFTDPLSLKKDLEALGVII